MAPIAGAAIALATELLPGLIGKVFKSKSAEEISGKVIGLAQEVTGLTGQAALSEAANRNEFRERLLSEFTKIVELETQDIQHARDNHKYHSTTVLAIKSALFMNPLLIILSLGCLVYLVGFTEMDGAALSALSAMIGAFLNQCYQERQQAYNFLVGSSLGSKLKTMFGGK